MAERAPSPLRDVQVPAISARIQSELRRIHYEIEQETGQLCQLSVHVHGHPRNIKVRVGDYKSYPIEIYEIIPELKLLMTTYRSISDAETHIKNLSDVVSKINKARKEQKLGLEPIPDKYSCIQFAPHDGSIYYGARHSGSEWHSIGKFRFAESKNTKN